MTKSKVYKLLIAILLIVGTVDIDLSENSELLNESQICAGVNGKQVQQGIKAAKGGWKFLRGCVGCENKAKPIFDNKKISPKPFWLATESLEKSIGEIKAFDDVLPKIDEYLSQTETNEGGQKVINCFKNNADEVRMCLYDNNKPRLNKLLLGAKDAINLAEYDVEAMQEYFYKGTDGIEYVNFIIPRHPQYILNGKYEGRIYECMIFNIPKNIECGWERFKEYLIAFIDDILNRPIQLWDEWKFRQGLIEMNINSRDVTEIEKYIFAKINDNRYNESIKHIQKKVA